MSAHDVDRERFMVAMEAEGMEREISRRILRHAQTIQRLAELECSSEAADRDQVRCPANPRWQHEKAAACLCIDYGTGADLSGHARIHGTVPRYMVQSARAERLIREWCAKATAAAQSETRCGAGALMPYVCRFVPVFDSDPRGACVKLKVPSGRYDDHAREGICVPVR